VIASTSRSRRAWLLAAVATIAAATAAGVWVSARPAGTSSAFTPVVLGAEPPGAVVEAREDRNLAVALAVQPTGNRLLLVATILGQDGNGAAGLNVSFCLRTVAATASVQARSGSPGYYEAETTARDRPVAVDVSVRGQGAAAVPLRFDLPATWPPRPADAVVRTADRAYRRLHSLVTLERLASRPGHAVNTRYVAVAPDRLRITSDNGTSSVVIGSHRWDRVGHEPWQRSTQQPFPAIAPFWVGKIENATQLGTATVRGRQASVVSFAAPQMPAFFTAWIDKATGRTLELRMTAAAHFMHHFYGPFDAPQQIRAPTAG
jgi:hypothetical protein